MVEQERADETDSATMTKKMKVTRPLSSIIIDFKGRSWRLCRVCEEYRLTENSPLTCRVCGAKYGEAQRPLREVEEMEVQDATATVQ